MEGILASLCCVLATKKFKKRRSYISCRQTLNILVAAGFFVIYSLQINLQVVMNETLLAEESAKKAKEQTGIDCLTPDSEKVPVFEFTLEEKNILTDCFLWGFMLLQLLGGRFAEVIGPKRVIGYSVMSASVLTLFTPVAAEFGFGYFVLIRMATGFTLGGCIPAFLPLISKWIPKKYRTRFMVHMMLSSLVIALGVPLYRAILDLFKWKAVFYISGMVAYIWSILWFDLIYDSPKMHPWISSIEKVNLELQHLSSSVSETPTPLAWSSLLTSIPVWTVIISHVTNEFTHHMLSRFSWDYFKRFLSFEEYSVICTVSYLGQYLSAVLAATLTDNFINQGIWKTQKTRKVFMVFGMGIPCIAAILEIFALMNKFSISLHIIMTGMNGYVVGGFICNALDIAPNFAGTIMGIANTLAIITRIAGSHLLMADFNFHDDQNWQSFYILISTVYATGCIVFLVGSSDKVQMWQNRIVKLPDTVPRNVLKN